MEGIVEDNAQSKVLTSTASAHLATNKRQAPRKEDNVCLVVRVCVM